MEVDATFHWGMRQAMVAVMLADGEVTRSLAELGPLLNEVGKEKVVQAVILVASADGAIDQAETERAAHLAAEHARTFDQCEDI